MPMKDDGHLNNDLFNLNSSVFSCVFKKSKTQLQRTFIKEKNTGLTCSINIILDNKTIYLLICHALKVLSVDLRVFGA